MNNIFLFISSIISNASNPPLCNVRGKNKNRLKESVMHQPKKAMSYGKKQSLMNFNFFQICPSITLALSPGHIHWEILMIVKYFEDLLRLRYIFPACLLSENCSKPPRILKLIKFCVTTGQGQRERENPQQ